LSVSTNSTKFNAPTLIANNCKQFVLPALVKLFDNYSSVNVSGKASHKIAQYDNIFELLVAVLIKLTWSEGELSSHKLKRQVLLVAIPKNCYYNI
jgi:hypothetical protein